MEENSIDAFFDALIKDEKEREIIRLVSKDLSLENILEMLLDVKTEE